MGEHCALTKYGFEWQALEVVRVCSDVERRK